MFDINGGEALILVVIAVLVIGPERLPRYAEQLGQLVRRAREFLKDTKSRVDEELGDEVKDVDWAALDPRRYDPRRIVREALLDDGPPAPVRRPAGATPETTAAAAAAAEARRVRREAARGRAAAASADESVVLGAPADSSTIRSSADPATSAGSPVRDGAPFDDDAT